MTSGKLLGFGIALSLILTTVKLVFYRFLNTESLIILLFIYLLIVVLTIASVRRVGIINYLESVVVMVFWLFFGLGFDIFAIGMGFGLDPYTHITFWLMYPLVLLTIFLFHKKRHVDIRRGGEGK